MASENTVVLGAGESGTGAAILAKCKEGRVFLSDFGKIGQQYKNVLKNFEIEFEEGRHDRERILSAGLIVKSPGIPDSVPLIKAAHEKGIPVISEIEYAGRYSNAKHICITGSNGKTTTTLLTHHILKQAGFNAGLAGNVGSSFAKQVALEEHDIYVLEISSFQLDGMFDFKADIAVLTNITPDHLDRYDYSFERYAASKLRVIRNMTEKDSLIYCHDDPEILKRLPQSGIRPTFYPFSLKQKMEKGAWTEGNKMIIETELNKFDMTLEKLALQGRHNVYNSMASSITARLLDVRRESLKESLSNFKNVEHRLEYVANVHGVEYINDSKATNVNACWYALESIRKPIIWIAGGIDKGNDYSQLLPMVQEKVKHIICLGKDNSALRAAFSGSVEHMYETESMTAAVAYAYEIAQSGDCVLLSPACASFDLFKSYEERGQSFKETVKKL